MSEELEIEFDAEELKAFCKGLFSEPDYEEVLESMMNEEDDFTVDGVRFIRKEEIDEIQQNEMKSDTYILGCFVPSFLSNFIPLEPDDIESIQKTNPEAIGKLILGLDKLDELQQAYVSMDSYGHHFNHYNGDEMEFDDYYVFDNH